jgi:2-polyprenyl-3-methyl-5-hydroxy-6-metoxy-1,4-benzoquinol methylase
MKCWCGSAQFHDFSPDYAQCASCNTLVSRGGLKQSEVTVNDDESSFYGKNYWLSGMQEAGKELPDIHARARGELIERDIYWLRTLLTFLRPGGKLLEVGCSHGGFLALARHAGFDITGIELSPWVCDFAKNTFDVPAICASVEDAGLSPSSYDVIALMDVLEHFPDPEKSLAACAKALTGDGVLLVQTPCHQPARGYSQLRDVDHPFLRMLLPREHVFLFTESSVRALLAKIGFAHVVFQPAIFSAYDMFFLASRIAIPEPAFSLSEKELGNSPSGRMTLALLDLAKERDVFLRELQNAHQALQGLSEQLQSRLSWRGVCGALARRLSRRLKLSRRDGQSNVKPRG